MASGNIHNIEERLKAKGYQALDPFFILREGMIDDERNPGEKVYLNKARLEKIAETQNNRIEETGDATPIIVGHTKRHLLEKEQPPITGWATRFEVIPFFRTGTYGLKAIPWAKEEDKVTFDKYPRRSPELWTNPDMIDPISLLGANTPRFDLGPHLLQKNSGGYTPRQPIIFGMESMAEDIERDTEKAAGKDPAKNPANESQGSEMQAMKAMLDKIMGLLGPIFAEQEAGGAGGMPGGGDPMGGGGGGMPGGAPPMPAGAGAMPPMPPAAPVQAMAGCSPAGGMNTMMPQEAHPQQYSYDAYGRPMQLGYGYAPQPQYAAPQVPVARPSGDDARVIALQKQVAAMQLEKIETSVNQILDNLQHQIVISRDRDFQTLVRLGKAEQDAEVAHMIATRKPVEAPLPNMGLPLGSHMGPPPVNGPVKMSKEHFNGPQVVSDPALGTAGAPGPKNEYEQLQEFIRSNNGRATYEMFAKRATAAGYTATRPG